MAILPNISLAKPLGTDIYNVEVFNDNSTLIEQYINALLNAASSGLEVHNYPAESITINIDTVAQGLHCCTDKVETNVGGTLPETAISKQNFQLWCIGNKPDNVFQIFIDLTYAVNNIYVRTLQQNSTTWSIWEGLAKLSDISTAAGYTINYVDDAESSINVDQITSGTYIISTGTAGLVTGTLPDGVDATDKLLINSYGNMSNNLKMQNLYNLTVNPAVVFTRYKYLDTNGNYVWSEWEEGTMGGGNVKISVVDL